MIVFEGDDYIGGAVNLAARLCNVAQPGEVLATTETAAVAPDGCDSTSVGERAIPGLSHPVPLVRLGPLVGGPALGEATLAAEQQ